MIISSNFMTPDTKKNVVKIVYYKWRFIVLKVNLYVFSNFYNCLNLFYFFIILFALIFDGIDK